MASLGFQKLNRGKTDIGKRGSELNSNDLQNGEISSDQGIEQTWEGENTTAALLDTLISSPFRKTVSEKRTLIMLSYPNTMPFDSGSTTEDGKLIVDEIQYFLGLDKLTDAQKDDCRRLLVYIAKSFDVRSLGSMTLRDIRTLTKKIELINTDDFIWWVSSNLSIEIAYFFAVVTYVLPDEYWELVNEKLFTDNHRNTSSSTLLKLMGKES